MCVLELVELGCEFDRSESGELHLAREGGQTVARSAHAGDATGAAIMKTLRDHARPRVRRIEGTCVQLAVVDGRCTGGWVLTEEGLVEVQAGSTVLAAGGVGAIFESTTNPAGRDGRRHRPRLGGRCRACRPRVRPVPPHRARRRLGSATCAPDRGAARRGRVRRRRRGAPVPLRTPLRRRARTS